MSLIRRRTPEDITAETKTRDRKTRKTLGLVALGLAGFSAAATAIGFAAVEKAQTSLEAYLMPPSVTRSAAPQETPEYRGPALDEPKPRHMIPQAHHNDYTPDTTKSSAIAAAGAITGVSLFSLGVFTALGRMRRNATDQVEEHDVATEPTRGFESFEIQVAQGILENKASGQSYATTAEEVDYSFAKFEHGLNARIVKGRFNDPWAAIHMKVLTNMGRDPLQAALYAPTGYINPNASIGSHGEQVVDWHNPLKAA